jgi:hypothetical protein
MQVLWHVIRSMRLLQCRERNMFVLSKGCASEKESLGIAVTHAKKHLFPNHPLQLVAFFTVVVHFGASLHRDFVQANILDGGPDDRQAIGLRREDVNLIRALAHIAEQTLNGISGLNVSVHRGRKSIKAQEVLFILSQAADCLWIALRVFGFEDC